MRIDFGFKILSEMGHQNYKRFSSKILLFGEYLVLEGGHSLSFPYRPFNLTHSSKNNFNNIVFYEKIASYIDNKERFVQRIKKNWKEDILQGLQYESNIPVGYGLGSSGALVAAIYDEYITDKPSELFQLKTELAEIESFFHEKSSGIDPLTSFMDKPILCRDQDIQIVESFQAPLFSLYDSGTRRNAKSAIKHFNELKSKEPFSSLLKELTILSNDIIDCLLENRFNVEAVKTYSMLQLKNFEDFIPPHVYQHWKQGLKDDTYYMKLCGAGMGGMYLKFENPDLKPY